MNRLTEKVKNTQDYIRLTTKDKQEFINKLGKLEDLEEEIGCPLDMLLNIIKETNTLKHYRTLDIWFDYKGELISGSFATLQYSNEFIIEVETYDMFDSNYDCDSYELKVKDYKKTWWLKEDRSE